MSKAVKETDINAAFDTMVKFHNLGKQHQETLDVCASNIQNTVDGMVYQVIKIAQSGQSSGVSVIIRHEGTSFEHEDLAVQQGAVEAGAFFDEFDSITSLSNRLDAQLNEFSKIILDTHALAIRSTSDFFRAARLRGADTSEREEELEIRKDNHQALWESIDRIRLANLVIYGGLQEIYDQESQSGVNHKCNWDGLFDLLNRQASFLQSYTNDLCRMHMEMMASLNEIGRNLLGQASKFENA